jgi:hypothetical protein
VCAWSITERWQLELNATLTMTGDVNAAINHLAAGQAALVCGATVRPEESKSRKAGAMKQKPRS